MTEQHASNGNGLTQSLFVEKSTDPFWDPSKIYLLQLFGRLAPISIQASYCVLDISWRVKLAPGKRVRVRTEIACDHVSSRQPCLKRNGPRS